MYSPLYKHFFEKTEKIYIAQYFSIIMKRGKKAQFYIIGAVIIIIAMISLASVSNYVLVKKEPAKFIDLGATMDIEGQKVIEYGKYNSQSLDSVTGNFSKMMADYIGETNEKVDIVIIHGNSSNAQITVISKNSTGTITLDAGGANDFKTGSFGYNLNTTTFSNGNINVTFLNTTYPFDLGADEEFIFIMTKNEGFEQYVQSNKNV